MENIQIGNYLEGRDKNKGRCITCGTIVVWSRERLASHKRKTCTDVLNDEETQLFAIKKPRISIDQSVIVVDQVVDHQLQEKLTESKKERIDDALTHFFCRTGSSFRIADSDAFKKLVRELNPEYAKVMPSAKVISTKLLQKEYSNQYDELKKLLENATELTLTSDGWSNIRGDHLVNFVIQPPGRKPIFYKSIDTSGHQQTSEAVAADIIKVLNEIGAEKFCAVITDNANVMRRAWEIIELEFPHISANGCAAHVMNLFIKDILDIGEHPQLSSNASKIVKFVNNHHIVNSKFNDIRKELGVAHKLDLPVPTRWYSNYNFLNDLIGAKYALIKLIDAEPTIADIAPKPKSKEVINLIRNNSFWDKVVDLTKLIEFPTKIIGRFENDESMLNIVYYFFGELYQHYEDRVDIQRLLKNRWDFIMTESIGISFMLSPSYVNNGFYVDDDKLDIMGQIQSLTTTRFGDESGQKVLTEITAFMDKIKNLSQSRYDTITKINAIDYWKIFGATDFPNLSKIAIQVCGIPCSSAASERVWSIYRFIHSRLRNRLTNDKVEKLIFIYINSSILDKIDNSDYFSGDFFLSNEEP